MLMYLSILCLVCANLTWWTSPYPDSPFVLEQTHIAKIISSESNLHDCVKKHWFSNCKKVFDEEVGE